MKLYLSFSVSFILIPQRDDFCRDEIYQIYYASLLHSIATRYWMLRLAPCPKRKYPSTNIKQAGYPESDEMSSKML